MAKDGRELATKFVTIIVLQRLSINVIINCSLALDCPKNSLNMYKKKCVVLALRPHSKPTC